jgi:hypothetical protein
MPFGVKHDAPAWEGLLRSLGVIFVFLGVIWLFWKHNERTLDMLESQQVVQDRVDALSDKQRKSVRDLARAMESRFGLELRLVIAAEKMRIPVAGTRTIFIGIVPRAEQVVVVLPPLVERALGREFAEHLRHEHFRPYWDDQDWQKGLGEALAMIWEGLNTPDQGAASDSSGGSYRGSVSSQALY